MSSSSAICSTILSGICKTMTRFTVRGGLDCRFLVAQTPLDSGFTISLLEWEATIPSLWSAVKGDYLPLIVPPLS